MTFIRSYGGWIIVGALAVVIIYLLFKPVKVPDNSKAIAAIDSLTKENNALRGILRDTDSTERKKVDSLTHVSDSLHEKNDLYKARVDFANRTNIALAHRVNYYSDHADTANMDTTCLMLASRVILDSGIIEGYRVNTDRLIWTMDELSKSKDSIIHAQVDLIYSDSVVMVQQQRLIGTQQTQIKRLANERKLVGWIGRGLAVAVGVLAIMVSHK